MDFRRQQIDLKIQCFHVNDLKNNLKQSKFLLKTLAKPMGKYSTY